MDCHHEAIFTVRAANPDGPTPGELGVCAYCLAVLRFGEGHTVTPVPAADVADDGEVHRVVADAFSLKQERDAAAQ